MSLVWKLNVPCGSWMWKMCRLRGPSDSTPQRDKPPCKIGMAENLPRRGGVAVSGFARIASAPSIGPRRGPTSGDSHSLRLVPLQLPTAAPASTLYELPSVDNYRPRSRQTGFGPGFGRPAPPRFAEPSLTTAKAFSITPLPATSVFKEKRASSPVMRQPMFAVPRSLPQQWTPRSVKKVLRANSYNHTPAAVLARPLTRRGGPGTISASRPESRRNSLGPSASEAVLWHRRTASDPSDVLNALDRFQLSKRAPSPAVMATGDDELEEEEV